ncbi:MAG: methyltransferase domain-containing protein [Chloroflexi bacterium]|nr:methyltransferase domain-containing protein [Chloroflexota bacterium]
MTSEFGASYANHYDLLYGDKDYQQECSVLEAIFERHAGGKVRSILDLGCGTGNHTIPLAQRGYEVVGVDRSAAMLAIAKAKREQAGTAVEFIEGDLARLNCGRTFDAVLMMFAVLGYQHSNDAATAAMRAARRHLQPGGLFVCDFWYGPAVLAIRPSDRLKVIPTEGGQLIRAASGALDTRQQLCTVRYHLWRLAGDRLVDETVEEHPMRFFFPREIELLLDGAGFQQVRLSRFPEFDQPADDTSWSAMVTATAM